MPCVTHNAVKVNDINFIRPRERAKRAVELRDVQIPRMPFHARQCAPGFSIIDETNRSERGNSHSHIEDTSTYVLVAYSRREFCNKAVKDGAP